MRRDELVPFLVGLGLLLYSALALAESWPEHRGDLRGVPLTTAGGTLTGPLTITTTSAGITLTEGVGTATIDVTAASILDFTASGGIGLNNSTTHAGSTNTFEGFWSPSTVSTITVDAATTFVVSRNAHVIDCVGPETITTITGGITGAVVCLQAADADVCTYTDTAAPAANQLALSAAYASTVNDTLCLIRGATFWLEVSRGVN